MGNNISNKPYQDLKKHPNYKEIRPIKDETLVHFTLRFAGNLISPPQQEGESVETECKDLKTALANGYLHRTIINIWTTAQETRDFHPYYNYPYCDMNPDNQ